MRNQLSALDATFLEAEDSDPNISLAIAGLSIIEGPMPGYPELVQNLAAKVRQVPRCTQVLRTHPLDMRPPEWVDDPAFDIGHHVHHTALPKPGDDHALFEAVADIMQRRLDRGRPLWETWVIEGLTEDRWAILTKIHHCIADGISAMNVLSAFSDDTHPGTFVNEIAPAGTPSVLEAWRPGLNPLRWPGASARLALSAAKAAAQTASGAVEVLGGILRPAAASSLTGPVSDLRRYSGARVALDDVKKVCRAFDVTINDVALAAVSDSYREALLRRGEEPGKDSLRTLVPVSVRRAEEMKRPDNRVSLMLPHLPVDHADPVERLRAVHERLSRAKDSGEKEAGNLVMTAADMVPFALSAWVVRLLTKLPQRGVVTLATNVPGPRERLTVLGREVLRVLPVPPIALQLRTGVAILSYGDSLTFGIIADFDTAPDVDEFARGIERGVARLASAADDAGRRKSTAVVN